jgi:hypothetical protein
VTNHNHAVTTPTVRFGRLQKRGLLLGFSGTRFFGIAVAGSVATLAIFVGGTVGMAVTGPFWMSLLALVFLPWGGRPAVETVPTAAHFGTRRLFGQLYFHARPSAPRPSGTLALPGDAASLRFHIDDISGAAMVHDPHAETLTAVALVQHPAYVLLSPDEQSRRVSGWGRVLAGLAAQGTCARVQVLEVALPDSGRGITGWWQEHQRPQAPDWALREYQELMHTCAPAASTHRTLIALSLDTRKSGRAIRDAGRGIRGAAAVLRQDMSALEAGLREGELKLTSWLDEGALAATLRGAFDPAGMQSVDGTSAGRRLETAGPVAVEEHWDHLRHDSAYSAVLWISEWPRVDVPPSFLHSLVFQQGVRKTISITATPLTTAQAMRDIRRAKVEYVTDSAQKARIGTIADLSDAQELSDVMDRERALIAGHADLRFTGLIAVTAATKDGLDAAISQIQRAATQCGCETRLLCGQQSRAFTAAALPLARRVG